MSAAISRFLSSGILVVWGVLLSYFFFSGRIASYLHPAFHIWTGVSGVVLLLMAAGLLFLPAQEHDCCPHEHDEGDVKLTPDLTFTAVTPANQFVLNKPAASCDHDHSHGGRGWFSQSLCALVLVVPLVVATIVSPSQFGASTVMNRGYIENISDLPGYQPYIDPALPTQDGSQGAGTPAQPADYLVKNEDGDIEVQSIDLLYAAEVPDMRADFENKNVEVIGQFMPAKSNNAAGDRFNLVRMFVMCCAADARPVTITVKMEKPETFPDMSWVKVTGKATFPIEGGRHLPLIEASKISEANPPEETFIY